MVSGGRSVARRRILRTRVFRQPLLLGGAPCIRERIVLAALVLLLFLYLWLLFAADMGSELEIGHPELLHLKP